MSSQATMVKDLAIDNIALVLDKTTLQLNFDYTCLYSLDERLLCSPTDSFADVCWSDAVEEPVSSHHTRSLSRTLRQSRISTIVPQEQPWDDVSPTTPIFEKRSTSDEMAIYAAPDQNVVFNVKYLLDDVDVDGGETNTYSFMSSSVYKPSETVNYFPVRPPRECQRPQLAAKLRSIFLPWAKVRPHGTS